MSCQELVQCRHQSEDIWCGICPLCFYYYDMKVAWVLFPIRRSLPVNAVLTHSRLMFSTTSHAVWSARQCVVCTLFKSCFLEVTRLPHKLLFSPNCSQTDAWSDPAFFIVLLGSQRPYYPISWNISPQNIKELVLSRPVTAEPVYDLMSWRRSPKPQYVPLTTHMIECISQRDHGFFVNKLQSHRWVWVCCAIEVSAHWAGRSVWPVGSFSHFLRRILKIQSTTWWCWPLTPMMFAYDVLGWIIMINSRTSESFHLQGQNTNLGRCRFTINKN